MRQSHEEDTWNQGDIWQLESVGAQEAQRLPTGDGVWKVFEALDPANDEQLPDEFTTEDALLFEQLTLNRLAALGVPRDRLSIELERLAGQVDKAIELTGRYKIAILFSMALASLAVGVAVDPAGSIQELRPVLGVLGVAEAVWIGGAVVCLVAIGRQLSINPLKIMATFKGISDREIAEAAKNNPLFLVGFLANLAAAIAEGAIPTGVIVQHSGPEGLLRAAPFLLDLTLTGLTRGGMFFSARASRAERNGEV